MDGRRQHICECLEHIAVARGECPITICEERRKTGKQLCEGLIGIAGRLVELGLTPGEVVAIAALNSELYLEWFLAITFVGGIVAPLNYRWSFEEAREAMELVKPSILVVDEYCNPWSWKFRDSIASLRHFLFIDPSLSFSEQYGMVLSQQSLLETPSNFITSPDSVALICFTSGTTGRPKGVALSHAALIVQSQAKIGIVGYNQGDVYLHTAPLCHIGGISSALAMLMVGSLHVFVPKFSAASAFRAIYHHSITSFITVPTMMVDLISFSRTRGINGDSVRRILNGGGVLSPELAKNASQTFPNAKILSAYGMTEACSSLTFMTLHNPEHQGSSDHGELAGAQPRHTYDSRRNGLTGVCVGKPETHVEIRIEGHGSDTSGAFVVGNILTRGVHVMEGYWCRQSGRVSPCSSSPLGAGWLDTGDIGWFDEQGNLWLQGRSKDRIKSGGENVYPQEVETVISQHPGISEIVVIGVPDSRLAEGVAACVRIREGWHWMEGSHNVKGKTLSSKILQLYCKQMHLTGFKIPRIFILWNKPFPRTPSSGKVRRREVKEAAVAQLQILHSSL